VLFNDVPYGKIIETLLMTQSLKMPPGLSGPIFGIVVLIASPIFLDSFDSYILKILIEIQVVILEECFQCAGFCEIKACPVCCSLFGWWQWHLFDFVRRVMRWHASTVYEMYGTTLSFMFIP
jgi:hypothetical protein